MTEELPVVALTGAPYDAGLAHGVEARELIAQNIRLYLRRFAQEGQIDRSEIRQRANAYRRVIEETNPGYGEELRGIAEGARQDILDVVAMNVRYEILYTEFVRKGLSQPAGGGCTSFALLPNETKDGHLIIGQNWDWIPEVKGIVAHANRSGQPEQLAFTEAGIAGAKIGFNESGLGLAINGLLTDRDSWSHLRKPFHVRCYEILASRTLDEALRAVLGMPRACSANFLLAMAGNPATVVDIEAAPDAECRLEPTDGVLVHTNHFLEPDRIGVAQPLGEDRQSTYARIARMQEMIQERRRTGEKIGVEHLMAFLADHRNEPYSVCRHASLARPENERFATVLSAIIDLDAREMFLAAGNPCTAPYIQYTFQP